MSIDIQYVPNYEVRINGNLLKGKTLEAFEEWQKCEDAYEKAKRKFRKLYWSSIKKTAKMQEET